MTPDEVLSKHESLSMATKTMFCEREKVEVLNINQQNDKSTHEFIMFGPKKQLQKCTTEALKVNDDIVPTSEIIKYLGAWLDQHLSFKIHIMKKCQTAMMNLQRIKAIHHMLSQEACHQLMLGLVMSHFDYMNAISINQP